MLDRSGLRVSELCDLKPADVRLGRAAFPNVRGGRTTR
jgi:integrase